MRRERRVPGGPPRERTSREIRASGGTLGGQGPATADIVTGGLAVLMALVVACAVLEMFASGEAA
jgi:hypothetical protein